ncbi:MULTISPECIES: DUF6508 domain-containing protein [Paenibacillus]|uniref:Uncharacterized protein n=1 Tax=Paenibacillus vini TaxID=1476024 RepID=A0ABQ4MCD1_9BACL|nr:MULTISPECIES: DUF6508 domain-containing protein [Paenibacillus]MBQ4898233.1 hypothetical protein [Paenibacillus sp. Marseille-P2973]GIP53640.1 hypothetical protein J42TS3_26750 [Paenibacillus vini]
MPSNGSITKEEIKILIDYLEFFQNTDSIFFTVEKGYWVESSEVSEFRKQLSDTNFLIVFDWVQWISDNKEFKDINNDLYSEIMNADLETLRKLMTSYIRGDRFNEGLFINVILKGHVTNILLRLQELSRS